MNRLSSQLKLAAMSLAASLSVIVFTPVVASAATTKESPFCTNLSTITTKVNTSISNLKGKMTAARSQLDQQLATNRAKWDQEIKDNRAKWDQQRQNNFTKSETKATTDPQKTAVKVYESAIISAVNIRRAANDAARTTYRTAVDNTIAAQRSTIDGQVTTFINSVNSAESTAQASCQTTPNNGPAIRTQFQSAMKSARETYSSARKNDGKISDQLKQLAQTRNTSFNANDTAFKASAKAARDALKTAFGGTSV